VFTALRDEADGLHGDVRIMPTKADDLAALLDSGVDELSIEFRVPKADHTVEVDGVRWRVRAHLDQVALEPKGAYSQARVLAYRDEVDDQQRAQAEADAAKEAERQELEALGAAEKARRDAEAEEQAAALKRRQEFDALAARVDHDKKVQQEYIRDYGMTLPPGR
jgi:regulator of protease activity HflC (stomatin/prohibitin superfamily)